MHMSSIRASLINNYKGWLKS